MAGSSLAPRSALRGGAPDRADAGSGKSASRRGSHLSVVRAITGKQNQELLPIVAHLLSDARIQLF